MPRPDVNPRVFISYARSDGEVFAHDLRLRLQAESIPLWRDREAMEGGRDWWLQITEALDHVEFLVLVMTKAALESQTIRREWRYARQRGVTIYPVLGTQDVDFSCLPRWMRAVHFYTLEKEWIKFINDLNTRPGRVRVPFMVEDLPPDFVPRSVEYQRLVSYLLNQQNEEPIAITTALRGVGGYGKTVLARALCHDEAIQNAFDDGILWVTLGEKPGDLTGRVQDLIFMLSGQRPGFSGIEAATAFLVELIADRDILMVIDDVWDSAHLEPFIQGGPRCARLITTRMLDVLPAATKRVDVDAMRRDEAIALLGYSLPQGYQAELEKLAERLGEWPLLLKLVNGTLRERVVNGQQNPIGALAYVNKALDKRDLTFFDAQDASSRHQAVAKTLGLSISQLNPEEQVRFKELAIFPEDVAIPLTTLEAYWARTGKFDELDTERLCDRFNRLSLVSTFDPNNRYLKLHDVIRQFLVKSLIDSLASLHSKLIDALRPDSGDWADLSESESYFWDHLAFHLQAAGRGEELVRTVRDLRYLTTKTLVRNALATEADLIKAELAAPEDETLHALRRSFVQCGHILNRCEGRATLEATFYSRLKHIQELSSLTSSFAERLSKPRLEAKSMLPDLPHPALVRTFTGHAGAVLTCSISSDGLKIVSAGTERLLKVWQIKNGKELLSLEGHTSWVRRTAVSSDGLFIISASFDRRLRIWDAANGETHLVLMGHTDGITDCAISPNGMYIVSTSLDRTVRVWDTESGKLRYTFAHTWKEKYGGWFESANEDGHWAAVNGCAISQDNALIASVSSDQRVILWDANTGNALRVFSGHDAAINGCAFSPDGNFIASGSSDRTTRIWDCCTGALKAVLKGHAHIVTRCAWSLDGKLLVTSSADKTVKVWDICSGTELQTLFGHADWVNDCAISPDGLFIASASSDGTVKLWDTQRFATYALPQASECVNSCAAGGDGRIVISGSDDKSIKVWDGATGALRCTLLGHEGSVRSCAISHDNQYIVSASADQSVGVWDIKNQKRLFTFTGHRDWVNSCAINIAGNLVLSGSNDCTVRVWDTRTRARKLAFIAHSAWVNSCAFSPDETHILSASADGTLKLWPLPSDEALWEAWLLSGAESMHSEEADRLLQPLVFSGHTSGVTQCAFAPDNSFIVSASEDSTLRLWNISTGMSYLTLMGHRHRVTGCAVSSDSRLIASVSEDGSVKIWSTRDGRCLMTFNVDGDLSACAWNKGSESLIVVGLGGIYFLQLITEDNLSRDEYG